MKAQPVTDYDSRRIFPVLLAATGMATQWAALHSITFVGTVFENANAAHIPFFWDVNTVTTFLIFLVFFLMGDRSAHLLERKSAVAIMGIATLLGQILIIAAAFLAVPTWVIYAGDVLLSCGTTPLILAWGGLYSLLDPRHEQLFVTLVGIVASVMLYFMEVELPDALAIAANVMLVPLSLACLVTSRSRLSGLSDSWIMHESQETRPKSAKLYYICIAVLSIPYNFLMGAADIQEVLSNHAEWASVLAIVMLITIAVSFAEVAAELHGFLLAFVSVLVLLSAAMLFHLFPTGIKTTVVPSLLFSGYYLFLATVYLSLGPIVATGRNPIRVFSAAMLANVGGLILGLALRGLTGIVNPQIASALVMALAYAILLLGFVLLSSKSYSIFRINYFDSQDYSFEYVVPVIPAAAIPYAPGKGEGLSPKTGSYADSSFLEMLQQHCSILAAKYDLSSRELQVLTELARGKTIPTIADDLVVSENTIKAHTKSIYRKIGIHTREELIAIVEKSA
jgi:DNA-binding CsgD family transcriptional regulator